MHELVQNDKLYLYMHELAVVHCISGQLGKSALNIYEQTPKSYF